MMNTTLRAGTILVALLVLLNCGSTKTPTRPSTVSLIGTVTAQDGAKLSGAIVRIGDGLNAGRFTTTNDEGKYRFDGVLRTPVDAVSITPLQLIRRLEIRVLLVNGILKLQIGDFNKDFSPAILKDGFLGVSRAGRRP